MIVTHTFLNKTNTIYKNSELNVGLNPICSLFYGKETSRVLLDFDINNIKKLIEDKTYPDISKLHHKLKMFNCADVRIDTINLPFKSANAERTQSFDLELRPINKEWDNGRGFDIEKELYTDGKSSISTQGSNWFNYKSELKKELKNFNDIKEKNIFIVYNNFNLVLNENLFELENKEDFNKEENKNFNYFLFNNIFYKKIKDENNNYILKEIKPEFYTYLNKWETPGVYDISDTSNVIATQHFEYGNENLEIDITNFVNDILEKNTENDFHGFLLNYKFDYEQQKTLNSQYVGFFSAHTNSFFQPYIETTYDDFIEDDRTNFIIGKTNRLYFYASVGSQMVNLDRLPDVMIQSFRTTAKQATKGIYYVEINPDDINLESDTMYDDVWFNLFYNGKPIKAPTLYFTPKDSAEFFNFGLPYETVKMPKITPHVYGIKQKERIKQGNVHKVFFDCKLDYTSNQNYNLDDLEYRLYVNVAEKQIDVINWTKVDRTYNTNEILIDTENLVPCKYFIDIKAKYKNEIQIYNNVLEFEIISDYLK